MSPLPQGRRGRVYAVLLLVLAAVLGYGLFVHWWFMAPLIEARSELLELRDREQQLRTTALQRPLIEQRLAEVRAFEAQNPGFLPEADFELAASGLIQRLQALVDAQNAGPACTVVSRSHVRHRDPEPFQRVTVQVQLRCEMEHFAAVLHGLETGSPQLFVGDLNITSRRGLINAAGRAMQAQPPDIRFSLYGYLQQPGATP